MGMVADKFRSKYSSDNIKRYYSKLDAIVEFTGIKKGLKDIMSAGLAICPLSHFGSIISRKLNTGL